MAQESKNGFKKPLGPMDLRYYYAPDGGFTTTYTSDIAHHEGTIPGAVGPYNLGRQIGGRPWTRPRKHSPPPKPKVSPPPLVVKEGYIQRLAAEIREAEGLEVSNAELAGNVKYFQSLDHVTSLHSEPTKGATRSTVQLDYVNHGPQKVDTSHHMQKSFYRAYQEELVKFRGILADKTSP
eukprot:CAMPEP_0178440130 /NCGR_PEP_ID=MMETSP0689_2-20121128/36577_1 /TAXON_ID=160604 /ORGANISM="Amphidinium massartii, Strain CS-259" /LENGTH=179 /DNA_ID=CAMNT_0020062809 /DNA_START=94 /DNA_END=633 /DNA_ORIENTATION=+